MKKLIAIALISIAAIGQAQENLLPVQAKKIDYYYNHQFAPSWISTDEAVSALNRAAKTWEACGIEMEFKGVTDTPTISGDGKNVFGWHWVFDDASSRAEMLLIDGKIAERDIQLNRMKHFNLKQTESSFLREIGKSLGVLEPSHDTKSVLWPASEFESRVQTRLLPDDIEKCQKANASLLSMK